MEKLIFNDLTIELTRRCNMACVHCLRGDAQDKSMCKAHIDALLDQTQVIGHLHFAGGEPTLEIGLMEYIADQLYERRIPIGSVDVISNGKIYNDDFVYVMKWYKELIDVCAKATTPKGTFYIPSEATDRCIVGISLDLYHTDHDLCMEHYERYKRELKGYAEVLKIMRGNAPLKIGRASCLPDCIADGRRNEIAKYHHLQRVEVLDKDHVPICKVYDMYHLESKDQKMVCCGLYADVNGFIRHENVSDYPFEQIDAFPQICSVYDPIWSSVLKYQEGRLPCAKWWNELYKHMAAIPAVLTTEVEKVPDAQDELTSQQQFELFKTLCEAIKHGAKTPAQVDLWTMGQYAKKELRDWKEIASAAAQRDYFQEQA